MLARHLVRDLATKLGARSGYDLISVAAHPRHKLTRFLKDHGITVVIDVGGNSGQFGQSLRESYDFKGEILSFEPLPDAFAVLSAAAMGDGKWRALNIALGAAKARLDLNVAGNSQSSSFLQMNMAHVIAAPESRYTKTVEVAVERLDQVPQAVDITSRAQCMLKIDTQGYEKEVVEGAEGLLSRISLIYAEVSLIELYDKELLIEHFIAFMRGKGFVPISIHSGFSDSETGRQLQADVLFAR